MRPLLPLLFFLWLPTMLQAKPQDGRARRLEAQTRRLTAVYPSCIVTWADMDPDNAKKIVDVLVKVGKDYPGLKERLKYVTTHEINWLYNSIAFAGGRDRSGEYGLLFRNSRWKADRSGVERTVYHESGHLLEFLLRHTGWSSQADAHMTRYYERGTADTERWADECAGLYLDKPKWWGASRKALAELLKRYREALP